MQNSPVVLSEKHPSLLEDVVRHAGYCAPIIANQDCVLIDGYRRYLANPEIDVIHMKVHSLYDAAVTMNRNTRQWDDIDTFLWSRWAESLNVTHEPYPAELRNAPVELLQAIANRKLQIGQAIRIQSAPAALRPFFVDFLTTRIRLNVNETAVFMDLTFDLANRQGTKNVSQVFDHEELQPILTDTSIHPKKRGEHLLKAMRRLRYPLYQRKSEEQSAAWKELNLEQFHGNQGLFLTRGILELTVRARSQEELSLKVKEMYESLKSDAWGKLWGQ